MPLQVAPELSNDDRAFFYLLHVLGEKGRATLRSELLKAAENDEVVLWGGVPGALFSFPYTWKEMEEHVTKTLEAWDGQRFVLGIADQVPPDGDIGMVKKISDFVAGWKG